MINSNNMHLSSENQQIFSYMQSKNDFISFSRSVEHLSNEYPGWHLI